MPFVDGAVVLQPRVGTGPGRKRNLIPEVGCVNRLHHFAGDTAGQVPVLTTLDLAEEVVGHAHGVVRVLTGNGQVGVAVPIGVVGRNLDFGEALPRHFDHAVDVVVRHLRPACFADRLLQRRVGFGIETLVAVHGLAGRHDRLHVLVQVFGACNQAGDLLLFDPLPVDVGLDIGVVGVDRNHFGSAAGRPAGLDGTGRPVADAQEGHQARGLSAPAQALTLAAQGGEVRPRAGTVLEQSRFTHPQIHDAAIVDQIVGNGLDETGVGLRVLVGRLGLGEFTGLIVDVVVTLARTIDTVGPVQAGVEPLRGVRRGHLARQHVAHLVEVGLGVVFAVEVATLPRPVGPGTSQTVEHLPGVSLTDVALFFRQLGQCLLVGNRSPQERRHAGFFHTLQTRGHARFPEIFLRQNIAGNLAEILGHPDIGGREDQRPVRVSDFR